VKDAQYKLDKRVTNREFKLLLKPAGLDRRNRIMQLDSLLSDFCLKSQVTFFHSDNATTGLRNVIFYDTPSQDFRQNNLILRVRESRQHVWVDDWCEVTFKCRAGQVDQSLVFDPTPSAGHKFRLRFKEEILRGIKAGTAKSIYSNNAVLDAVPIDALFKKTITSAVTFFPGLSQLNLSAKTPVRIVGGRTNKILEASLPLGTLVFGSGVQAHCDVAIWMRSVGDPIVGELGFSYRVTDENRGKIKAHQCADQFFKDLQLAIADWLQTGTTKTELVYRQLS